VGESKRQLSLGPSSLGIHHGDKMRHSRGEAWLSRPDEHTDLTLVEGLVPSPFLGILAELAVVNTKWYFAPE
jgi:hypothetical protein